MRKIINAPLIIPCVFEKEKWLQGETGDHPPPQPTKNGRPPGPPRRTHPVCPARYSTTSVGSGVPFQGSLYVGPIWSTGTQYSPPLSNTW